MRSTRLPDPTDTWTSDDARVALEEGRRSGLSLAAFALDHGIGPARLYWWRKRLGNQRATLSLIRATVVEAEAEAAVPFVVRLPNGVAIEIASGTPSVVAAIVAALARAAP